MRRTLVSSVFASAAALAAPCKAGEINLYSINTGSFVYHMTGNHGQYNEKFNNDFSQPSASCRPIQSTACSSAR